MFLDSGRKSEDLKRTQADTGRTATPHRNHYTTVSPSIQYTILDLLVLEIMTHHLMSKKKIKRDICS